MKYLGRVKMETLVINQHVYIKSIIGRFDINKDHLMPASSTINKSREDCSTAEEGNKRMTNFPYREAVGTLVWASTMTRPDIGNAIRNVEKYHEGAGQAPWKAAMKILQHLRGTAS